MVSFPAAEKRLFLCHNTTVMASKIKSEDLRLNIIVGDGKGRKELQDLQKAIKDGKKEVDSLNKSYKDAVKQYGEASASAKKYSPRSGWHSWNLSLCSHTSGFQHSLKSSLEL